MIDLYCYPCRQTTAGCPIHSAVTTTIVSPTVVGSAPVATDPRDAEILRLRARLDALTTEHAAHDREQAEAIAAQGAARLAAEANRDRLAGEVERLRRALSQINAIRNSIVGFQAINWSEHIYPLVAALDEAGIEGLPYPKARENSGTLLAAVSAAERDRDTARKQVRVLREALRCAVESPWPSHTAHWDPTGGSGAGCPACGDERFIRARLNAALAATAPPEPTPKEPTQ